MYWSSSHGPPHCLNLLVRHDCIRRLADEVRGVRTLFLQICRELAYRTGERVEALDPDRRRQLDRAGAGQEGARGISAVTDAVRRKKWELWSEPLPSLGDPPQGEWQSPRAPDRSEGPEHRAPGHQIGKEAERSAGKADAVRPGSPSGCGELDHIPR